MSMLTPLGQGGRRTVRRGARRSRLPLVVAVVVTAALVAGGWWWSQRDTTMTVAATPRPSCPAPSPTPTVVAPAAVRVNVYNATSRKGLASTVGTTLRHRGFRVGTVDNDPLKRRVTGLAEVRSSALGVPAARTVAAQVGAVVAVPDQRKDASVDLVLGAAFRALQPVPAAAAALSPTPQPRPAGC